MGKKSDIIKGKDEEIAALTERLSATQEELVELRDSHDADKHSWKQKEKALLMEKEALQNEVEVLTEMHERLLLRVQAESAAYAARVPAEEQREK